ncbi:MAG: DUF4197 domain-containing protein [Filimonas sp.]|nr:DUF4197 domain-containing protein [Filimonas sp.]
MKKILLAFSFLVIVSGAQAQFKNLLKNITSKSSSSKDSLSSSEVSGGLKEALNIGIQKATTQLSATDGFFKDAAIKLLLPPEAQKVEKTLRSVGMGKLVDDAVLSMNRAAEDATKSAAPIFLNAVKEITLQDVFGILKGGDSAATKYLRGKTTAPLTEAFRPSIDSSLGKTGATKYWNTMFTAYNKLPLASKVNPDLTAYVTEKALSGIFSKVAQQEALIRKDPVAQTTDLLKKVFGK